MNLISHLGLCKYCVKNDFLYYFLDLGNDNPHLSIFFSSFLSILPLSMIINKKSWRYLVCLMAVCLLICSKTLAQAPKDNPDEVLKALNRQVDFLNAMDKALTPAFLDIIDLNQDMLDYYYGEKDKTFSYASTFNPSDTEYKKAIYQKFYLPEAYRDDLIERLDSMKATMTLIAQTGKQLEAYLTTKKYEKDNMRQGFDYLKYMSKLLRSYLVRHEALHATLRTTWHEYYIKGKGVSANYQVEQMSRILSTIHVVYLDLGYDPGYMDANKHLEQANTLLDVFKTRLQRDSAILKTPEMQKFLRPLPLDYFSNYGKKDTTDYFQKFNREFIADINRTYIPAFNAFIEAQKIKAITASTEPPFVEIIAPKYPDPAVITIVAPKDSTPTVVIAPPKKDTFPKVTPPIKKDTVVAVTPPKPSVLEGYATNNLIFLLDVSGSMKSGGRLDSMKSAMRYIVEEMRPQDKIGIVTYSGDAQTLLRPTSATEKRKIYTAINNLYSNGKSNLWMGMEVAYTQMRADRVKGGNNRIIVVTDGYIPLPENLEKVAANNAKDNITLSVFLFGNEADPNANGTRLKSIAQAGGGNFTAVGRSNAKSVLLKEAQAIKAEN